MNEEYRVVIYTRDNCHWCGVTKTYLLKEGIEDFVEMNTDRIPELGDILIEKGYREMPVVEWDIPRIGAGAWTGFKPEAIQALADIIKGEK